MFTVYILKSLKIDKYYIGHTKNFDDKKEAWKREKQLKSYKGGEAFKSLMNI